MRSDLVKEYCKPVRILEKSENVTGENALCVNENAQLYGVERSYMTCRGKGYILLDFGKELCGGIRILSVYKDGQPHLLRVRLRFGESVGEACARLGEKGACCDHSVRDMQVIVPCTSDQEYGNTGFRFVRIDFLDDAEYRLVNVYAAFTHRDLSYQGSFFCDDDTVNRIYDTARYTLFLNMQQGLWDGIKRDRQVWIGDMQPEVLGITDVFGADKCVTEAIDASIAKNPLPCWFGNIPTYSFWLLQILCDYYAKTGDASLFLRHTAYVEGILAQLDACVTESGKIEYARAGIAARDGYFLDWPTLGTPDAAVGNRYLFLYVLQNVKNLYAALGRKEHPLLRSLSLRLEKETAANLRAKQVVALGFLAGRISAKETAANLTAGGARGMSAFMSYFILQAAAQSAGTVNALNMMREYYGGMLSRGATSFWEDFDVEWLHGSGRIDERTPAGKKDLHGDFGGYCYKGYRHSLCHGWSCGPVPFLTEWVLGVRVAAAGCEKLCIAPHLGDLQYCGGTFPTPRGVVTVRHERHGNEVHTEYTAPNGIEIVLPKDGFSITENGT